MKEIKKGDIIRFKPNDNISLYNREHLDSYKLNIPHHYLVLSATSILNKPQKILLKKNRIYDNVVSLNFVRLTGDEKNKYKEFKLTSETFSNLGGKDCHAVDNVDFNQLLPVDKITVVEHLFHVKSDYKDRYQDMKVIRSSILSAISKFKAKSENEKLPDHIRDLNEKFAKVASFEIFSDSLIEKYLSKTEKNLDKWSKLSKEKYEITQHMQNKKYWNDKKNQDDNMQLKIFLKENPMLFKLVKIWRENINYRNQVQKRTLIKNGYAELRNGNLEIIRSIDNINFDNMLDKNSSDREKRLFQKNQENFFKELKRLESRKDTVDAVNRFEAWRKSNARAEEKEMIDRRSKISQLLNTNVELNKTDVDIRSTNYEKLKK